MASRWDAVARKIADLPRKAFKERLDGANEADRHKLLRMRLRWRIDEFGELVIRPIIGRTMPWYGWNAVNLQILEWPADRFEDRPKGLNQQFLMWAPRGSAKTTTSKIRTLHALVYGLDAGMVLVAAGEDAAVGWLRTLRSWVQAGSPWMKRLWPRFGVRGSQEELIFSGGESDNSIALHARGWTSEQIRGLNFEAARPTRLILDDIESDGTTSSLAVRDKAESKLLTEVFGLLPLEGGGYTEWQATPVHHDCLSARGFRRSPSLAAFDLTRYKAVIRWPESPRWAECKAIFLDYGLGDGRARQAAAYTFYLAHRAEMDAGAEVLDPERLPIFAAFIKRWGMSESAWRREYETDPKASSGRLFDSSTWATYRWVDRDTLVCGTRTVRIGALRIKAHWDPSDGGDDGGFAIVGAEARAVRVNQGRGILAPERGYVLHSEAIPVKATEQVVIVVQRCKDFGLAELSYEANQMSSMLRQALLDECQRQGITIDLVPIVTTENKNKRLAGMEAPVSTAAMVFDVAMPAADKAEFDDFNPARKDNRDNVMDAIQRAYESATDSRVQWGQRPLG